MAPHRTDSSVVAAKSPDPGEEGPGPASASADGLLTSLDEQWTNAPARDDHLFLAAIFAALFLHLLPIAIATGGWSASAQLRPSIGDPDGGDDGVNVEIIDADEYQRRFIAFTPGRSTFDNEAKQAVQLQAHLLPQSKAEATPEEPPEPSLSAQPRRLSDTDIAQIMASAKLDLESAVAATATASLATRGQMSEFVRSVLRKLKQNMPRSNGIRGTVVIGVVLSETGQIDWVGVLKTSHRRDLDELVVERVRATRFDPPSKPVKPIERKFQITYQYD